jgi:hypothetical protein
MQNKSFTQVIIWTLVGIIIIGAIVGSFIVGKNSSQVSQPITNAPLSTNPTPVLNNTTQTTAQTIPQITTSSTTTTITSTTSVPNGYKTFTSTEYGFSFNYPDNWILTQNPSKKTITVTSDTNYVQGKYSTPMQEITFTLTNSGFFNPPIGTKVGFISYDNNLRSLVDSGSTPIRCLPATPLLGLGTIKGINYAGSLMSDPAYSTFAVLTTSGKIIIVNDSSESGSGPERDAAAVIAKSFALINSDTTTYPTCALQ